MWRIKSHRRKKKPIIEQYYMVFKFCAEFAPEPYMDDVKRTNENLDWIATNAIN